MNSSGRSRALVALMLFISFTGFAQTAQDFTVVALPDTQFYSESYPDIFKQQTQWIVDNRDALNIQFVIGEGDIVNTPSQDYEWQNADAAIQILDQAQMPYALAIGNHDYDNVDPRSRSTTAYNQWFGVSRYSGYSWYGGHYGSTNENFYTSFDVNGQNYLIIALEFYPQNDVLSWMDSIVAAHPDSKIIVVTHSFLFTDGTRGDLCDTQDMPPDLGNSAEVSWTKSLKSYANLQLVLSGHLVATSSSHRTDLGDNGNAVDQVFTNFQAWTNGGDGYLRIFKFRPSLNKIEVTTYSPYLDQYLTTSEYQFELPITNDGNTATSGALDGKVRTPSCSTVAGAQVTANGETTTTDSNGRFSLTGLPAPADYPVDVTASGYDPDSATSTVAAGYSTQTDFYLNTSPITSSSCTLDTTDPSVTICEPAANSTVANPVHIVAGTNASAGVAFTQLYVDGKGQGAVYSSNLDITTTLATGTRRLTVQSKLNNGTYVKNTIYVTVSSGTTGGGGSTSGVTITSPTDGSTVPSPVTIQGTAAPSDQVKYIQLYVDGSKLDQQAGATYSSSQTLATGSHRITLQAAMTDGTSQKSTVNITVGSSSGGGGGGSTSGVTISSPVDGSTVTSPVSIQGSAAPSDQVKYIQLYVDGSKLDQQSGATYSSSQSLGTGSHRITLQAAMLDGTSQKSTVNITVSSTSGGGGGSTGSGVTISSPADGSTVTNPVSFQASASSLAGISFMQLYVDGSAIYTTHTSTLSTSQTLSTGSHRIVVQAKDNNGTYYKQVEYITVQ